MNYQQLIDVGLSDDLETFERRLVATADALGFPIISGVLLRGALHDPGVQGRSFGNPPNGHVEAARNFGDALRDPVLDKLMSQPLPVLYDQSTYAEAGAGELWEMQAPYGFKTGVAIKLHLPVDKHFLLGVDRDEALPKPGPELMHMVAGLQLLGAHAMYAADRLLGSKLRRHAQPTGTQDFPRLTKRELDTLSWTAQGKTAWEVGVILGMSEKTVNFHLGNAMRKLDVNSKHLAVLKCITAGVL